MTTYISILRGINVSGQKIIKMDLLRNSYESMGFHNITTYIQSGNVIFQGKNVGLSELEQKISWQIENDFGFNVPVIVLSIDMLKQIIIGIPFLKDAENEQAFLHVTFLSSSPKNIDLKIIEEKKQNTEEIVVTNKAVYLYCPNGYGQTKLNNNFLETKLKVRATTRNWKTCNELLKIAQTTESTS